MENKISIREVASPTSQQLQTYHQNEAIRRRVTPNLRFGSIAFTTDADLDG